MKKKKSFQRGASTWVFRWEEADRRRMWEIMAPNLFSKKNTKKQNLWLNRPPGGRAPPSCAEATGAQLLQLDSLVQDTANGISFFRLREHGDPWTMGGAVYHLF